MQLHCVCLHVYPDGVSDRCRGYLQALQGRPAGPSARCQGRSSRIDAPRCIGSAPTRCQADACRVRLASADLLPLPELPRIRDTMPRCTAAAACRKWMRCRMPAACRIAPRIPWMDLAMPARGPLQDASRHVSRTGTVCSCIRCRKGDYRGIIVIAIQYLPLHKPGAASIGRRTIRKKNQKNRKKGLTTIVHMRMMQSERKKNRNPKGFQRRKETEQ